MLKRTLHRFIFPGRSTNTSTETRISTGLMGHKAQRQTFYYFEKMFSSTSFPGSLILPPSFDFEITCMISDQIALHSVQLPLYMIAPLRANEIARITMQWFQNGFNKVLNMLLYHRVVKLINIIISHWTHYPFPDWPKVYSKLSKSAPSTSSSCRLYNNHVKDTEGHS